eukprot:1215646-Amorphochlora_amoeboformis.AAC.2
MDWEWEYIRAKELERERKALEDLAANQSNHENTLPVPTLTELHVIRFCFLLGQPSNRTREASTMVTSMHT